MRKCLLSFKIYNEYINYLNTGLVWYSNGRFVSDCQMVRHLNGGLKTGLKKACLWPKISGIQMVRQVLYEFSIQVFGIQMDTVDSLVLNVRVGTHQFLNYQSSP